MAGLVETVAEAGEYVVLLSTKLMGDANSNPTMVTISIYINGTQVAFTERSTRIPKEEMRSLSTQAHVLSIPAGADVDGRWRTSNGEDLQLLDRSLILIKMGNPED